MFIWGELSAAMADGVMGPVFSMVAVSKFIRRTEPELG